MYLYYTSGGIVGLCVMICLVYCFWNTYYKDKLFDYINENLCCGMLEYYLCIFEICSCVKDNVDMINDSKDEDNDEEEEKDNVRIEMKIKEKNDSVRETIKIDYIDGRKRVML